VQNEETPEASAPAAAPMTSVVAMSDAQAATQLIDGFYPLESGSWRWTAHRFSVVLKTPPGAAQAGATLTFAFSVPDLVASKVGSFSLSASSGGTALKTETYKAAGGYTFKADVPASLCGSASVPVDFSLDKGLPLGTNGDKRELGIIAASVGLAAK
jgi:hypothetical protein